MLPRYQTVDFFAMGFAVAGAIGCVMPWGRPGESAFDHREAYAALVLLGLALALSAAAPVPHVRKWSGIVLGLSATGACWLAIEAINETTTTDDLLSYLTGESMQPGLWVTLLASLGLVVVSVAIRTRERPWENVPVPPGAGWVAGNAEPAPPQAAPKAPVPPPTPAARGWAPVAATGVQRQKCPRCATNLSWVGNRRPPCANCGWTG